MAIDNQRLIEKADLSLQGLVDGGGALSPAVAQEFIRTAINEAPFMKLARTVPMRSFEERIPRVGMGNRILYAATPSTESQVAERTAPTIDEVVLSAKLFRGEVLIPDEMLEDNIEGDRFRNVITQMLGEGVARDIDEFVLNSDTTSADPDLAQFDGVIKQASAHIVDFNNTRFIYTNAQVSAMVRAIPKNFKRMRDKYVFLTSYDAESDYRDALAARATQMGDNNISDASAVKYRGHSIIPVPMLPDTLNGGHQTVALLMNPKDVAIGFWRNIKIEIDRNPRKGNVAFLVSLRLDAKITQPDGVVLGTEILN